MTLVAAMGLGLALTASFDPLTALNYETSWAALYAAEAGIAVAAHELAALGDWNPVLAGLQTSAVLSQSPLTVALPGGGLASLQDLTNLATCGHAAACSAAEAAAFTAERPWGANNPRWQLFGHARLDKLLAPASGVPPVVIVVWVGDDPADVDGDPHQDSGLGPTGGWVPGACAVAIRAEAFAPRFGHRTVVATVGRPGPGCAGGLRLVSWRRLN